MSKIINENIKASNYGLNDARIIMLRFSKDALYTIFKIIFKDEKDAATIRQKLNLAKAELMNDLKERQVHALVGPFPTIQDVALFKLYVVNTLKLKNVEVCPNIDIKTEYFDRNAYCKLYYDDLKIFNSMNKLFKCGGEEHEIFIHYYKHPANSLCRKCAKRYHGDSKCPVEGVICFRCGKYHDYHEHAQIDPWLPYCIYCKSSNHKARYCPHTHRKLVTYEEYMMKPIKQNIASDHSDTEKPPSNHPNLHRNHRLSLQQNHSLKRFNPTQ